MIQKKLTPSEYAEMVSTSKMSHTANTKYLKYTLVVIAVLMR